MAQHAPDVVISHLSVGPHAVDEEVFQSTMKYIFNFIEKVSLLGERGLTILTYFHRKSKQKISSKSSVSASGIPQTKNSGETLPSACHCSPTSRNVL
jgi:hypothetical protein